MKKILLAVFTVLLIAGCGGSDDKSSSCYDVTALDVIQQGNLINYNIIATGGLYYEISIVNPVNGSKAENGEVYTLSSPTGSFDMSYLPTGTVLVYARTVCEDEKKGDWFGPKTFTLEQYCDTPYDLNVTSQGFTWHAGGNGAQVSNYQVEYGVQGFTQGSGTLATVNNEYYDDFSMSANQSYDYYVRAYCSNNVGYGNWAGPFTYYSQYNVNMCLAPTNVTFSIESSNATYATVNFQWNNNGESSFEYVLVIKDHAMSEGTIGTIGLGYTPTYTNLYRSNDYDFYVRSVCSNGNKTAWTKKTIQI